MGGEAGRPSGQMDRRPRRSFCRRPSGTRPPGRGAARARCRGAFSGVADQQRRQSRRLSRRQRRRRADLSIRVSARHRVPHPGDRADRRRGVHEHGADRRLARARLWRGRQHHGAAGRCRGAAMRLRPRRIAPPQHAGRRGDAGDECVRQQDRQRRLSRDLGPRARRRRCRRVCRRAAPRASGAVCCAVSASPITSRRPAARRARMSMSASRRTAACR